jgi:hypothetical protein
LKVSSNGADLEFRLYGGFSAGDTIKIYSDVNGQPIETFTPQTIAPFSLILHSLPISGTVWVSLTKAGETTEGFKIQKDYDLSAVSPLNNGSGITASVLTPNEIPASVKNGVKVTINKQLLDSTLANAQYFDIRPAGPAILPDQTVEDLNLYPEFPGYSLSEDIPTAHFYTQSDTLDNYVMVIFYDAAQKPIAYYLYSLSATP